VGSRLGGQTVGCAAAQLHEFHVSRRRSTLKAIDILPYLLCTLLEQPLIAGGNHILHEFAKAMEE